MHLATTVVKIVEKPSVRQLKFKIKSRGIDSPKSFARFLDALAQNMFKDIEHNILKPKDDLLAEFTKVARFGRRVYFAM